MSNNKTGLSDLSIEKRQELMNGFVAKSEELEAELIEMSEEMGVEAYDLWRLYMVTEVSRMGRKDLDAIAEVTESILTGSLNAIGAVVEQVQLRVDLDAEKSDISSENFK